MISTIDIAWAAGFLEGEGWFDDGRGPKIGAGQKEIEPLLKLQKLFGGKIFLRKKRGISKSDIYWWVLGSHRSPAVMMTLYSFLSSRRQETIRKSIEAWKKARNLRLRGSSVCFYGHNMEGNNSYVTVYGHLQCKECKRLRKRERRSRLRALGLPVN